VIERNEIFSVLLETGDCGAIYCGRDWTLFGNVIRQNFIHDLPGTAERWQNAVYLDDMASGITVEGNLIFRCNLGLLAGGGRHVRFRHNVLVDCAQGLRFDARGVGWMAEQIADPESSTLHRRLRAVPVTEPPWSERFPELLDTLTVGPGRPVGSAVVGNAFVRTTLGKVEDPESVRIEGNVSLDRDLGLFTEGGAAPGELRFAPRALDVREVPGFPAIPLEEIGLPRR
jgi:hypothetical protein